MTTTQRKLVRTYDYTDKHGNLLFQSLRYEPKSFSQRRPDGNGGWIQNLEGVRLEPFHLPALLQGVEQGKDIYIVEGEKDVEALETVGAVATCNPMGALKWPIHLSRYFLRANVVIVADNDEVGLKHALRVRESIKPAVNSVRIVKAAEGKDASDHLAAGFGLADFLNVEPTPRGPIRMEVGTDATSEERTIVPTADEAWKAANDQWLADLKAGKFRKQRPPSSTMAASAKIPHSDEPALTPTRKTILALMAWAEAQAWPGRGGATDLQAYLAFLGIAYEANTLLVDMSQYRLAEKIGVGHTTAWRVMRRLERRGLLRPEASVHKGVTYSSDGKIVSSSYLLTDQEGVHRRVTYTPTLLLVGSMSPPYAQVPEAFWGRSGLSKAALRTYRLLDPTEGQSEKELAEKLGRNRSSVNRTLKQLAKFDLAYKGPEGWLLGSASLERTAETLTTAGASERMRAYHESLREGYREFLKHKESTSAERSRTQDVQAREGTVVSTTRETVSNDGRAAIPERGTQPVSSDHGRDVHSETLAGLGHNAADLLADHGARQPVGRGAVGKYTDPEREAACLGCGQVQTFTAPDLRPYSCAYCKGKFEYVDKLATVAA